MDIFGITNDVDNYLVVVDQNMNVLEAYGPVSRAFITACQIANVIPTETPIADATRLDNDWKIGLAYAI